MAELGRQALVHLELRANLEEKGRGRPGGGLERIRWVSWKHQQTQVGGAGGERGWGGEGLRKGPGQGARWWLQISRKLTLVPLSFTPGTEWESWAMTKAHVEDASFLGGRVVTSLGGRKKVLFTKRNFSISHL